MESSTSERPIDPERVREIADIQERYASRIKARLAEKRIDVVSARDGLLDCFVSTYFGGLKTGVAGYLGIDASEEQVAQIAQSLFKKRMVAHGASFDTPTVDALDRVKHEVDHELHIHELPGELRGLHDQVCSLLLSKADGSLSHEGDRSAVPADAEKAAAAMRPTEAAPRTEAESAEPPSAAPVTSASQPSTVDGGLRGALAAYLDETAAAVRSGAGVDELRTRASKIEKLIGVIEDFGA